MITYSNGNIFDSKTQTLVNAVNTIGVMGKGLALQFKNKYPDMFLKYKNYCEKELLDIGKLYLYKSEDKWILNFPTKKHWKNPSKYEYIESGLQKFIETYKNKQITSISFPKLGCNNGKLDWKKVHEIMIRYLSTIDIDVVIYC